MSHLRARKGVFYYRSRLPADIRKLLDRTELCYSLGTIDPETALALSHELRACQLRLCRVLRHSGRTMTKEQLDQVVTRYMEAYRANREQDAVAFGRVSPEFAQQRRDNLASDLQHAEQALAENDLAGVGLLARDLLAESGVNVDTNSEAFARLCHRLLDARVDVLRADAKKLLPSQLAKYSSGSRNDQHNGKQQEPVTSSPRLPELMADYLVHRDTSDPMRPDSRTELVAAFAVMADLLGDVPFLSIRNRDAQDFATQYAQLPNRWRKTPEFRGKTAREVLALSAGRNLPTAAPATVNKEMGLLKAFWVWACRREERQSNPMSAVDPLPTGNAKDKRHPFSMDEIKRLASIIEAERTERPERFWVVSMLAYTGARLEEIAQLRTSDVVTMDGITCIRIMAEAGSLKNVASERVVPVHSALIAKGFLAHLATRPAGSRLWFDEERPSGYGAPISKWFARQITALGFEHRNKKGLHSFRHTMIDALRAAKVDPLLRREIVGHAASDTEDGTYGSATGLPIAMKQEALELVRLPV